MLAIRLGLIGVLFSMMAVIAVGQDAPATGGGSSSDPVADLGATDTAMDADLTAGVLAVRNQNWDEAVKLLEPYVASKPKDRRALTNLAYAHEKLAERARADVANPAYSENAAKHIARAAELYLDAAALADQQGEKRIAEAIYGRVLLHQPGNLDALLGQARILAPDRPLQALDRYTRYIKSPRGQKDVQAHLELARVYRNNQYTRKAMDVLEDAVKLSPDNPDVQIGLARVYGEANEMDKALAAANRALELAPDTASYHNTLANLLLKNKQPDKAIEQARLAIQTTRSLLKNEPANAQLLIDLNSAFETYRQALEAQLGGQESNVELRLELARAIRQQAAIAQLMGLQRAIQMLKDAPPEVRENSDISAEITRLQREFNEAGGK